MWKILIFQKEVCWYWHWNTFYLQNSLKLSIMQWFPGWLIHSILKISWPGVSWAFDHDQCLPYEYCLSNAFYHIDIIKAVWCPLIDATESSNDQIASSLVVGTSYQSWKRTSWTVVMENSHDICVTVRDLKTVDHMRDVLDSMIPGME